MWMVCFVFYYFFPFFSFKVSQTYINVYRWCSIRCILHFFVRWFQRSGIQGPNTKCVCVCVVFIIIVVGVVVVWSGNFEWVYSVYSILSLVVFSSNLFYILIGIFSVNKSTSFVLLLNFEQRRSDIKIMDICKFGWLQPPLFQWIHVISFIFSLGWR